MQTNHPPSPGAHRSQPSDDPDAPNAAAAAAAAAGPHDTTRTSSQCSSQESQLLHLSRVASMQEKLDGGSRKRTADGAVKGGHSRTASAVSVSTSGSRIGELTSDLKTRLSYAMIKVNHGWQAHSIDEVESMASQAASPASSSSTAPRRHSASPALPQFTRPANGTHATPPASQSQSQPLPLPPSQPHSQSQSPRDHPSPNPATKRAALAPPAPIQPGLGPPLYDGRPSRPGYTPTLLSHSHTASPYTPALGLGPDPIILSPHHQAVRDQDAIEALMAMSSPGNHHPRLVSASPRGPPSSAPARTRQPLPTSQPRKGLPGSRPRAESAGDYSPQRGAPRRRVAPLRSSLSMSAALGAGVRRRLRDEEIERMLERAGEESSEDEGEILIPRMGGVVGSG